MNFEIMKESLPLLLAGAGITVEITAASVGLGLFIGVVVSLIRLCGIRALRILGDIYVTFLRGTPLLVQIFLVYFALPALIHHRVDAYVAAISACSINSGAYVAEIFRGGIESIDKGQMEAGRSLGMTWWQTMRHIILPQAFKNVLPSLGNEFIVLLKETSVSGYIALQDLTKGGDIIRSQTYTAFMPLTAVALIYLSVVMLFSWMLGKLERKLKNNE